MLVSAAMAAALVLACHKTETEEDVDLKPLVCEVPVTDNWVFESKPAFTLKIENPNNKPVKADLYVKITTDKGEKVKEKEKEINEHIIISNEASTRVGTTL